MTSRVGFKLFALANMAVFFGTVGWLGYSHLTQSERIATVVVADSFEPVRSDDSDSVVALPTGDAAEGFALGEGTDRPRDPDYQRVRELFRAGNIEAALVRIQALIGNRPKDATLRNDLGVYLSRVGDSERAANAFEIAIELSPAYARAHFNLGTLRLRSGAPERAVLALGRALELNPYYREARFNRASAYTQLGDQAAAEEDYRFLTGSDRSATAVKAQYNLGILLARDGRNREAIRAFTTALRQQPDHLGARFNKALLLSRAGLGKESLVEYEKLLELDPDHEAALLNAGAYLLRQEDWESAVKHFQHLITVNQDESRGYYNLGLCHAHLGDDEGAVEDFTEAISRDPAYAEAYYNLGLARKRLERLPGASEAFQTAVRLRPEEPTYHYNLALTYASTGETSRAVSEYDAALGIDPGYFKAAYNLGLAHYHAERLDAAAEAFERARELRPDSYAAAYNLGLAQLKSERYVEAEQSFRDAIAIEASPEARYNLGLSLQRRGELESAMGEYRSVLREDPKHVRSIERLAEALSDLGRHDTAIERLALLQKLDAADPTAFNQGLRLLEQDDLDWAVGYFEIGATGSGTAARRSFLLGGRALKRLNRTNEAADFLQLARRDFPEDDEIRKDLITVLLELDRDEAALPLLHALQEAVPDSPTAFNRGVRIYRKGQYELGRRYFEIAQTGSGTIARKGFNMDGMALKKLDRLTEAVAAFEQGVLRFPDYVPVIRNLCISLVELGRHTEAIRNFAVLQKLKPLSPTVFNVGLGLYREGEHDLAIQYFQVGTRGTGSVRRKSSNMRALALRKLDRPVEAIEAFTKALAEFPGDGPIARNLAETLSSRNRHEDAVVVLEDLVRTKPRSPETLFILGSEYRALGKTDSAKHYFDRVIEIQPDHARARAALESFRASESATLVPSRASSNTDNGRTP